jgi:hypothetical protein
VYRSSRKISALRYMHAYYPEEPETRVPAWKLPFPAADWLQAAATIPELLHTIARLCLLSAGRAGLITSLQALTAWQ